MASNGYWYLQKKGEGKGHFKLSEIMEGTQTAKVNLMDLANDVCLGHLQLTLLQDALHGTVFEECSDTRGCKKIHSVLMLNLF